MRTALCIVVVLALGAGCLGTETGNPPAAPEVDVSRIALTDTPAGVEVSGVAGAIDPGGGTVRIVNLDGVAGLVISDVAADGSFSAVVEGSGADLIRLQARLGDLRSPPIDFQTVIFPTPASDCVDVEPASLAADYGTLAIGEPGVVTVGLVNGCGAEITVTSARMRFADPAFAIGGPVPPWPIADGGRATVDVTLTPAGVGETEDVLIVDVLVPPDPGTVAITLYGEGG
jgi:hypothetical protein